MSVKPLLLLSDRHRASSAHPDLDALLGAVLVGDIEDDAVLVGVDIEPTLVGLDDLALHVVHLDDARQAAARLRAPGLLRARAGLGAIEPERRADADDQTDDDGSPRRHRCTCPCRSAYQCP